MLKLNKILRKDLKMLGAIIGDIAGSTFEFNNYRKKDFEIFAKGSCPTDDTLMTVAVANAIMKTEKEVPKFLVGKALDDEFYKKLEKNARDEMVSIGKDFVYAEFGPMFNEWIWSKEHKPYESWGDGAAMRISPVGFCARNFEEASEMSRIITGVSHNHPETFKGAECVVHCIMMLRNKTADQKELKEIVQKKWYKDILPVEHIRKTVGFDASCQYVVPQAISCFLESKDFEDAIRTAVSSGGDSDTVADIAGALAEAYWGIPEKFKVLAEKKNNELLMSFINDVNKEWEKFVSDIKPLKRKKKWLFF